MHAFQACAFSHSAISPQLGTSSLATNARDFASGLRRTQNGSTSATRPSLRNSVQAPSQPTLGISPAGSDARKTAQLQPLGHLSVRGRARLRHYIGKVGCTNLGQ